MEKMGIKGYYVELERGRIMNTTKRFEVIRDLIQGKQGLLVEESNFDAWLDAHYEMECAQRLKRSAPGLYLREYEAWKGVDHGKDGL